MAYFRPQRPRPRGLTENLFMQEGFLVRSYFFNKSSQTRVLTSYRLINET